MAAGERTSTTSCTPAAGAPSQGQPQPRPGLLAGVWPADPRARWAAAAVALAALISFAPVVQNGFVNWDDDPNLLHNYHFRAWTGDSLKWAWSTFLLGVYQPAAWMLYGLEYQLWRLDPGGYHATSLLLHAVCAVALFALGMALLRAASPALVAERSAACHAGMALAAALFAVSPLRTEVVAWASCQPYLPCALFTMLAVLVYLRAQQADEAGRHRAMLIVAGLYAAALLCKAVPVMLPAVLVILDIYPLRRLGGGPGRWLGRDRWPVWWEKLPVLTLSVVFMVIAVRAKQEAHALVPIAQFGLGSRLVQSCYGLVFYLVKTLVPVGLTAYYPLPARLSWAEPRFLGSIVAVVGVTAVLVVYRNRWPVLLAAWAAYVVLLLPTLGIVRIGDQLAADRYGYVPLVAVFVVLGGGLAHLFARGRPRGLVALATGAAGLAIFACVGLSWRQCRTWHDSQALWAHAIAHGAERAPVAHNNLGLAYRLEGRPEQALAEYRRALQLDPNYVQAHNNLGSFLLDQGELTAAENQFTQAVLLRPKDPVGHLNRGVALDRQGKYRESLEEFVMAAQLQPDQPEEYLNLGVGLEHLGRPREAIASYREALRLDPNLAQARRNLASALLEDGHADEAAVHFREAVRLRPNDAEAHAGYGTALARLGRLAQARTELDTALRLAPDDPAVHHSLGLLYAHERGGLARSEAEFRRALELKPKYAEARNNLGQTLLLAGHSSEARAQFVEALRLRPGYAEAHSNLGALLARQGKLDEAIQHFTQAVHLKPRSAEAHTNLGAALARQGKYDEAIAQFSEALLLNPNIALARTGLNEAMKKQQQKPQPPGRP